MILYVEKHLIFYNFLFDNYVALSTLSNYASPINFIWMSLYIFVYEEKVAHSIFETGLNILALCSKMEMFHLPRTDTWQIAHWRATRLQKTQLGPLQGWEQNWQSARNSTPRWGSGPAFTNFSTFKHKVIKNIGFRILD
jgi:hypothetical protein